MIQNKTRTRHDMICVLFYMPFCCFFSCFFCHFHSFFLFCLCRHACSVLILSRNSHTLDLLQYFFHVFDLQSHWSVLACTVKIQENDLFQRFSEMWKWFAIYDFFFWLLFELNVLLLRLVPFLLLTQHRPTNKTITIFSKAPQLLDFKLSSPNERP